ncbi:hypothetical protein Mro03_68440 [Microbispora rosea subsp. rosea]|nr:hypothetical protein Mro03_68440 [Microbispora rosea subsp. rosea]
MPHLPLHPGERAAVRAAASASEARAYSGTAGALALCPLRRGRRAAAAPGSPTARVERGVGEPVQRKPYVRMRPASFLRRQRQDIGGRLHGL